MKSGPKYRIDPKTGCHIWLRARSPQGYGRQQNPRTGKFSYAHIVAWEEKHGPVPKGKELDHFKCDNPACRNPNHLKPVTHKQNLYRSEKWRKNFPGSGNTRKYLFSKRDVERMRKLHDEGLSQQDIANMYGCHQPRISKMLRGLIR